MANRAIKTKKDFGGMAGLIRYFRKNNISPKEAIKIMAFAIYLICKSGEDLEKWEK